MAFLKLLRNPIHCPSAAQDVLLFINNSPQRFDFFLELDLTIKLAPPETITAEIITPVKYYKCIFHPYQ